jgi:hypothetical protein
MHYIDAARSSLDVLADSGFSVSEIEVQRIIIMRAAATDGI